MVDGLQKHVPFCDNFLMDCCRELNFEHEARSASITFSGKSLDLADKVVGFDAWRKAFHRSLRHELNKEGVPLSYVIRKNIATTSFTSLQDELQY